VLRESYLAELSIKYHKKIELLGKKELEIEGAFLPPLATAFRCESFSNHA
jgi:hypothetical protein